MRTLYVALIRYSFSWGVFSTLRKNLIVKKEMMAQAETIVINAAIVMSELLPSFSMPGELCMLSLRMLQGEASVSRLQ